MIAGMHEFWAGVEYSGQAFRLFGTPHLSALGLVVMLNGLLLLARNRLTESARRWIRYALALLLLVNESLYHLWRFSTGQWTVQEMLPFHVCTVMVYLSAVMLITKNRAIYQYLYFLGIGAATQALLTPNAERWGFPHFRFFQTMISHGAIVTAALYMTLVERYRPQLKALGTILIGMNIYIGVVQGVNMALGSNYLWIARKPNVATVIDYLGPWPWYILSMEALGVAVCLLLYLPFAVLDWRHRR